MSDRAKKAAANHRSTLKVPFSARPSDCVLVFLIAGLLLRGGDIEQNPGPGQDMDTGTRTQGDPNVSLSDIAAKLEDIMSEQIDMKRTINERFATMENGLKGKLDEIDSRIQTANDDIDALSEKMDALQDENECLRKRVLEQDSKIDYIENQSRRQNLLFHNMPKQQENETWEDCERAVQDVIRDVLGAGVRVAIDRAHRVGSAIIVRFQNYKDKERILRLGYKFKGTNIGVSEDFSRQVREKRKGLIPLMKSYHNDNKRATLVMDKLRTPDGVFTFDTATQRIQQVEMADSKQPHTRNNRARNNTNGQSTSTHPGATERRDERRRWEDRQDSNESETQSTFMQRERRQRQAPFQSRRDNETYDNHRYNEQFEDNDSDRPPVRLRGFGRGTSPRNPSRDNYPAQRNVNNTGSARGGWWYRGRGRGSPGGGGDRGGDGPGGRR